MLKKILFGESGQSFMEYGLIATLVVLAAVGAYTVLGNNLSERINSVSEKLKQQ